MSGVPRGVLPTTLTLFYKSSGRWPRTRRDPREFINTFYLHQLAIPSRDSLEGSLVELGEILNGSGHRSPGSPSPVRIVSRAWAKS